MGLFSGLTKIFTSNSTKKNAKSLSRHQQNLQKIENFQRKRRMLRQFRQLQGVALQTNIATGGGVDSSLGQGLLASQGQQARVNVIENQFQEHSQRRIFETSGKIQRNQNLIGLGASVDEVVGSFTEGGVFEDVPGKVKSIFTKTPTAPTT